MSISFTLIDYFSLLSFVREFGVDAENRGRARSNRAISLHFSSLSFDLKAARFLSCLPQVLVAQVFLIVFVRPKHSLKLVLCYRGVLPATLLVPLGPVCITYR